MRFSSLFYANSNKPLNIHIEYDMLKCWTHISSFPFYWKELKYFSFVLSLSLFSFSGPISTYIQHIFQTKSVLRFKSAICLIFSNSLAKQTEVKSEDNNKKYKENTSLKWRSNDPIRDLRFYEMSDLLFDVVIVDLFQWTFEKMKSRGFFQYQISDDTKMPWTSYWKKKKLKLQNVSPKK